MSATERVHQGLSTVHEAPAGPPAAGVVVLCEYFPPAGRAGGPLRSIPAIIRSEMETTRIRVLTRGRDFGVRTPFTADQVRRADQELPAVAVHRFRGIGQPLQPTADRTRSPDAKWNGDDQRRDGEDPQTLQEDDRDLAEELAPGLAEAEADRAALQHEGANDLTLAVDNWIGNHGAIAIQRQAVERIPAGVDGTCQCPITGNSLCRDSTELVQRDKGGQAGIR